MTEKQEWSMVKRFAIFASVFLAYAIILMATGHAQLNCNSQISDQAGVLNPDQLSSATSELTNEGADVHIITVPHLNGETLEQVVGAGKAHCASWQSPNGGVKANMLVIALAPNDRKMGIFTGPSYRSSLDPQLDRIKRDYMAPHFKGADWNGGIVAAENQLAARIKASLDESNKPVTNTTTTNVAATDLHGFWIFLYCLIGLAIVGFTIFIVQLLRKRKEELEAARQDAINTRDRVVNLLSDLNEEVKKYTDVTTISPSVQKGISILDVASKQYSDIASTEAGDPTESGMPLTYYQGLGSVYARLEGNLKTAKYNLTVKSYEEVAPIAPKQHIKHATRVSKVTEPIPEPVAPPPPTAPPSTQPPVVVVRDNSNDFATGILLGEAMNRPEPPVYREPEREPEPVRTHHDDDDDSSSKSDDSFGGSSSSFGSDSNWGGSSSDSGSGGGFGGDSSGF